MKLLKLLFRLWVRLGELIGKVTQPVIMGILFFGIFTPVGMLMRLFGRDALRRKYNGAAPSYWIVRQPRVSSMAKPF